MYIIFLSTNIDYVRVQTVYRAAAVRLQLTSDSELNCLAVWLTK